MMSLPLTLAISELSLIDHSAAISPHSPDEAVISALAAAIQI